MRDNDFYLYANIKTDASFELQIKCRFYVWEGPAVGGVGGMFRELLYFFFTCFPELIHFVKLFSAIDYYDCARRGTIFALSSGWRRKTSTRCSKAPMH